MSHIMDFLNNYGSPKRDGITVYKINQKTHNRIEIGKLVNSQIVFNKPNKISSEVDKIVTCRHNFQVYTEEDNEQFCSHYFDNREVFVRDNLHSWSIGYWENDTLVLWSQYE